MASVTFTEYIRPNGRTREIQIPVSKDVANQAQKLIELGGEFTIEKTPMGLCLTFEYQDDDYGIIISKEPDVERLVNQVTRRLNSEKSRQIQG